MNIRKLAELAGVSVSTVSKIMNNKDSSISTSTRERVLQLAKEYNYQSYSSVIEKRTKTLTLGFLCRSGSAINMALNGIVKVAQNSGYTVMLRESGNDPEIEAKNISVLCSHHIDGVIWEFVNQESSKHLQLFSKYQIPVVIFNSFHPDSINIDYEELGYNATQSLINIGHTKIACILTPGTRTESFAVGYKQCLFHNHIPLNEDLIFYQIGRHLMQKISAHSISAMISSHYKTAVNLYDAISELHYELPYDISLISLKDDFRKNSEYPKISTFTIPHYEYGEYLCKKLIYEIEKCEESLPAFHKSVALDSEASIGLPYDSRSKKIVVIGSINIDNYLKLDTLPHTGKTVSSSISSVYVGGKAINEAVGAARLGQRVSVVGRVGNDVDSDMVFQILKMHNIDSIGVKRCSGYKTGQAYIFVQNDGDSMISIMSGANEALTIEHLHEIERIFDNAAFCLVQTEIPMEIVEETCKIAKSYGIQTILKPTACGVLTEELLHNIDIIVPNAEEANEICPYGNTMEEKAEYLLKQGVGTVIITTGAQGCYVRSANISEYYPAQPFDVIDASGAADAFISALASYLLDGYALSESVKIATYAAGFSISREGVTPSLIDKNTLEAYIRQKEPNLLKV